MVHLSGLLFLPEDSGVVSPPDIFIPHIFSAENPFAASLSLGYPLVYDILVKAPDPADPYCRDLALLG